MALSRKRARELKKLKHSAASLWQEQREVLDQANRVVREASRQVGHISRDEVAPRVKESVSHGATVTKQKIQNDVFPSVASALASALAVIEVTKAARVRDALKAVNAVSDKTEHLVSASSRKAKKKAKMLRKELSTKVGIIPPKSAPGPGRYIVMGVGVVALAGIGYAVWQTLRADDDLWISDEPEQLEKPETL